MATSFFNLPDVGEGLTEAEIVSWQVQPGDSVAIDQVIVEIETAKSLVELPSPFAGVVSELLVAEGEVVEVGSAIISITGGGADSESATETEEAVSDVAAGVSVDAGAEKNSVLVGYGSGSGAGTRRRRGVPTAPPSASGGSPKAVKIAPPSSVPAAAAVPTIAKPPIRKLAKDLDVDLREVEGTGLVGEITRDDVVRHASQASVFKNIETPAWPGDREDRIPVKGVRKAIATAMVSSAFSAPHVSLFVDVDATRTMEFIKRLKNSTDFAGVKISPLLIMAKAMIWAVRRNPTVNSSWTDTEIIVRHYVNLGIAAATPRGLIVPNIKEAQSLSLLELAKALEQLTLTAREGKTPPADQAGGNVADALRDQFAARGGGALIRIDPINGFEIQQGFQRCHDCQRDRPRDDSSVKNA